MCPRGKKKWNNMVNSDAEHAYIHPSSLLSLPLLPLLFTRTTQPHRAEEHKPNARADCAGIVRPCCAQESWVLVVPWWYDGDSRRTIEVGPSARNGTEQPRQSS